MKLNLQLFASGTIEFSKKTGNANWKWIQAKVVYSESNARLDNGVPKSDVTVSLYGRVGTGGTSGRKWIGYVSIDGTKVIDFSDMGSSWADKAIKDTYVLYKSATTTVTHNSDGSKNITIAGGLTGPSGSSIAGLKSSGSSTVSLDTIPTAPILSLSSASSTLNTLSFTVINTIAGGMTNYEVARVSDGTVVKSGSLSSVTSASITLTGQSVNTNYSGVYKIRCYANGLWGNWLTLTSTNLKTAALPTISNVTDYTSGNTPTISLSSIAYVHKYKVKVYKNSDSTLIATSGDFTSLSSALSFLSNYEDTILSYIPNNISITLKYEVIITYNSTDYNIGTKTATYTIQSSHYNPTFSSLNINYEDTNSTTLALTGDSSKIIKGFSNVKFTISPMTAQKSATGKSYNISTGNRNTSINYSSSSINTTINGIDGGTYTIQAVDSRDKNTQVSGNYNSFVDYSSPSINSYNINRLNGVGQNLNISFNGTFYNWSGLSVNNSIQSIVWKYRRTNTSSWTDGGTISSTTYSGNTFTVSNYSTSGDLFDTSYDYYIRISVTDRLTTEEYDYYIPSGKPLVWKDLLNKKIGINKKPEYTFDIDGSMAVSGNSIVNGIIETEQVQIKNNNKTLTISNDTSGNTLFTTNANKFNFNKSINCDSLINKKYKKEFVRVAGYVSTPTYYLLAKLPASTAETGDILNIKGYLGGYASNEQAVIDVQIGNRGGLRCNGTWIGVDSYAFRYSRLRLYTNNGETYVYLMTNGWCGNVRLEISGMWNEIYDTFPSTTTPVGTLTLDVNEKVLNNASDVYSTDEIVIGKWINDKPIYRKVLDLGSVTTIIGTSHFNHNISNFDVLVNFNIKAYFQSQNAWYNWWEAYKAMTVDATQIHIHTSAATTFSQVYITLEYTKTTD